MTKIALSLLCAFIVAGCSFETRPRTIHTTGEYGLFEESIFSSRKKYLFRECGSGDRYTLSFDNAAIGQLYGKIIASGAKPDETIVVELEAASTAEQLHVFNVTKVHAVRWGSCEPS